MKQPHKIANGLIAATITSKGWSQVNAAKRLGVSRVALSRVVNHHADVSVEFALKCERLLGMDAYHILRTQISQQLLEARAEEKTDG